MAAHGLGIHHGGGGGGGPGGGPKISGWGFFNCGINIVKATFGRRPFWIGGPSSLCRMGLRWGGIIESCGILHYAPYGTGISVRLWACREHCTAGHKLLIAYLMIYI